MARTERSGAAAGIDVAVDVPATDVSLTVAVNVYVPGDVGNHVIE